MPSPVIHVGYALGFGALIMASTKGSFTALHCLLLAFNAFFGPDIGSFLGWCLAMISPTLANAAMTYIHHSLGYIVLIAPILAFLSSKLSKKLNHWVHGRSATIDLGDPNTPQTSSHGISLNLRECYLLSIAGCLLHFQLDHVFEEDGRDSLYLWILSTGYFTKPTPPVLLSSVLLVGGCTLALFFGFAWIHLISATLSKQPLTVRLQYTFGLFATVGCLYGSFLAVSQLILKKQAVVGEEADLGVLVFIVGFHFLPFILCLLSIRQ